MNHPVHNYATPDGIIAGLRWQRQRLAGPAYDGRRLNATGLALIEQLDCIIGRIEMDLAAELDAMAEHYDSDPTPPHGIERPALNTCVVCGRPGAAWWSHRGEFVHYDCTRCNDRYTVPNPANPYQPYAYRCEQLPNHTGPHLFTANIRHGAEWTRKAITWPNPMGDE